MLQQFKAARPPTVSRVSQRSWVHPGAEDGQVCSDIAQVAAYSLAIAALRNGPATGPAAAVTLRQARTLLEPASSVLAAAPGSLVDTQGLLEVLQAEVGALERLVRPPADFDVLVQAFKAHGFCPPPRGT
jgi:hypothetical protein